MAVSTIIAAEPPNQQIAGQRIDPEHLYRAALIKERTLRTPGSIQVSRTNYHATIDAFTTIARDHPRSSYAAQALWQAAGLCLDAFERWHLQSFRSQGTSLLNQLLSDYSQSPLSRRVPERLQIFSTVSDYGRLTRISKDHLGRTNRYTLALSHEANFTTQQLTAPTRIYFDLSDTTISDTFQIVASTPDLSQPSIRVAQRNTQTTRVVIDLAENTHCSVLTLYEPFRIVADCQSPTIVDNGRVTDPPTKQPRVALSSSSDAPLSLPRQLGLSISRVVIDPGHGGHDPGASGHGLTESMLTLDLAKRLTTQLHASGVEVILTRQSDHFVPLEKRADLAARNNADLFLSLHVNASQRKDTRGIETYVLDFADDEPSRIVATRENQQSKRTLSELDSYVRAITTSAKTAESDQLASYIQKHLVNGLKTLDPALPDLGIKRAPFVVLVGTHVPSVLVEVGFLSNPRDAALLKTEHFLDSVASAIASAVLRYRSDFQMASPQRLAGHAKHN